MFGLFLTATVLSFVLIFVMPISIYTRWLTLAVAILAFLNALFVTVASVIATVMFIIFRNTIGGVAELNISAEIGVTLFAFMWVASAFANGPNETVAAFSVMFVGLRLGPKWYRSSV